MSPRLPILFGRARSFFASRLSPGLFRALQAPSVCADLSTLLPPIAGRFAQCPPRAPDASQVVADFIFRRQQHALCIHAKPEKVFRPTARSAASFPLLRFFIVIKKVCARDKKRCTLTSVSAFHRERKGKNRDSGPSPADFARFLMGESFSKIDRQADQT